MGLLRLYVYVRYIISRMGLPRISENFILSSPTAENDVSSAAQCKYGVVRFAR